jgi:hypothetical protein
VRAVTPNEGNFTAVRNISARGLNLRDTITVPIYRSTISADANDFSLGGWKPREIFLQPGSTINITGFDLGQTDGQEHYITNGSFGQILYFPNQSTSSAVANRISTGTGATIGLAYAEKLHIVYHGGTMNRWVATKVGFSITQLNQSTNGLLPQDWFNTLLYNSAHLVLGEGVSLMHVYNDEQKIEMGDTDGNGQNTKYLLDDGNVLHRWTAKGSFNWYDPNAGDEVWKFDLNNTGSFADRRWMLASPTVITDTSGEFGNPIDLSVLFEVRSTVFDRGSIPAPSLQTSQRDAITSPKESLQVYNNEWKVYQYFNGTIWKDMTPPSFADATARDAAITAPYGGQQAYVEDTGLMTYYNAFLTAWQAM